MPLTRLVILSLVALALPGRAALAESKPCWFAWWPSHWRAMNWEKRHFEDAKTPIVSQWASERWTPGDWIAQSGGDGLAMVQGFYNAGIVTDQYTDDDTPVLEVGPAFFHLGGYDKRRIVAAVDQAYRVTGRKSGPKTIRVVEDRTGKTIGYYTASSGLVLQ